MKFKIEHEPPIAVIELFDAIDEQSDFNKIPAITHPQVVIDLKNVDMINSFGARNWIKWLRSLKSVETISLRKCPAIIVHLMNVLEGFKPSAAIVESVYVPYYCRNCDEETTYLATRGHDFREASESSRLAVETPKVVACKSCSKNIEPGVVASRYFKFLKSS
jgi:hypothetical protein